MQSSGLDFRVWELGASSWGLGPTLLRDQTDLNS